MGLARRLRNAISFRHPHRQSTRAVQIDSMADRYEDRIGLALCAQCNAHRLSAVDQRRIVSGFLSEILITTDQYGFGASYRRLIDQKPYVRRYAQPSRMRNALTVEEDRIGFDVELLPSFKQR